MLTIDYVLLLQICLTRRGLESTSLYFSVLWMLKYINPHKDYLVGQLTSLLIFIPVPINLSHYVITFFSQRLQLKIMILFKIRENLSSSKKRYHFLGTKIHRWAQK